MQTGDRLKENLMRLRLDLGNQNRVSWITLSFYRVKDNNLRAYKVEIWFFLSDIWVKTVIVVMKNENEFTVKLYWGIFKKLGVEFPKWWCVGLYVGLVNKKSA